MSQTEPEMPKRTRKQKVLRMIKYFAGLYLFIAVMIMIIESWIMFPGRLRSPTSIDTQDPSLSVEYLTTSDNTKLQATIYAPESPRGIVIACHGNGDLICYKTEESKFLSKRLGNMAVLQFDYRGYGESEGSPNSKGLQIDGKAAYDFAIEQGFPPEQIFVYGQSLGGAVAVSIARDHPIGGLALKSTFASMTDVAASKFPWLPVRLLLRNRFPSRVWLEKYHGPLVQVHGNNDWIVAFKFGRELHEAAINASDKKFIEVEGMGHNQDPPDEFFAEFKRMIERQLNSQ